jgi:hypothetical protein
MTRSVPRTQQSARAWTYPAHRVLLDEKSDKVNIRVTELSRGKDMIHRLRNRADSLQKNIRVINSPLLGLLRRL